MWPARCSRACCRRHSQIFPAHDVFRQFGAMGLLYVLFSKFVPIISIWELKVGEQPEVVDVEVTRDEAATLWRTNP